MKLEPHATCGFVRVTFISEQRIAPGGLPPPFASTEWLGVERVDVEIGDVEALAAKYPDVADDLQAFQQRTTD